MDAQGRGPISTDELLAALRRRGLGVTRTMLAQDVRAGYLPAPEMEPRGPRAGIGRWWTLRAAQRATYLYRLRRRGVQGNLLRVLVFLHDGWGWEQVQPLCLAGLAKLVRLQGRAVTSRLRHPIPANLDFLAEEFAEGEFASPAIARFIWGLGFFGQPLPGGSLRPFAEAFRTTLDAGITGEEDRAAEQLVADSGLTWERARRLVEAADAEQADAARRRLLVWVRWFRRLYHAYLQAHGHRGRSSNPLTLFACPPAQLHALCRSLPGRPTPAQLLAALLVPVLVLERLIQAGELPEEEAAAPP